MSTSEKTQFKDNMDLLHAFFVRKGERKLLLFVDVEKPSQLVTNPSVSEINELVMGEVVTARQGDAQESRSQHVIDWDSLEIAPIPQEQFPHHVIDWDGLEIAPIPEEQLGSSVSLMEDEMFAFVGLRADDKRAEQSRLEAEKQRDSAPCPAPAPTPAQGELNLNETEVDVNDVVPGEAEIFYNKDDPPMKVGSSYVSMVEFRSVVRQHAIKGQFKLGTKKTDKERFRGYCTAEGCPWAIVARLMPDRKSMRVTLNKFAHSCTSSGRVKTKMASYKWVAEKAIPFLKKDPNMGAKKLKEELETKYNVTIGYSTVWAGRRKAAEAYKSPSKAAARKITPRK